MRGWTPSSGSANDSEPELDFHHRLPWVCREGEEGGDNSKEDSSESESTLPPLEPIETPELHCEEREKKTRGNKKMRRREVAILKKINIEEDGEWLSDPWKLMWRPQRDAASEKKKPEEARKLDESF